MPEHFKTETWPEKPKRRWQNLLHQKCPNCDCRLEQDKRHLYFICPTPHPTEPGRNCFFIKKEVAAQFLLDPNHPANFCLSQHERATVEQAIHSMGITEVDFMKKPIVEPNYGTP